jgi:HEAT repeat protein
VRPSVALWLTLAVFGLALVPAAWVLAREALRRLGTARALRKVEAARKVVGDTSDADAKGLAQALGEQFDTLTIDRAVLELIRSGDARQRAWGSRLFAELGLVDRYMTRLRKAPKWSERTHAAEVLGLAAVAKAVPALVEVLRDRHEDESSVKVAAASALAKLRDPSAIALLVKELLDVDEQSSRTVAEALVAFGELAVGPLLELLPDAGHPAGRLWAARILGRIGDSRAVDDLVARLNDRDDRLRMAAAEALGAIADARALQPIVRATLRDPAPQVRAHAAGAVARIEGERAVDVLVAALADPDYATRIRALEAFETMRIEDTSPLEAALRDPNAEVRRRAALALERVGYLERIVANLTSEDRAVRTRAFASLIEVGQVGLVESVASYAHHSSFEVRAIAARACGELGAARVAPILLRAIDDPVWPVRAAVCQALGRLSHADAPGALVRALADSEEPVREAAAEALMSYSSAQVADHVETLAAAYDRGSVAVRQGVVTLAGRIEGATAEGLLVRASVDPSDVVRLPAVAALGQRGGDAPLEPLIARLTDASVEVRMAAVIALGAVGKAEAFEGLLRALPGAPGAPGHVRDRIAEALARIGGATLFERLPEIERNASLDVRLGMVWALGKLGDVGGVPALGRSLRSGEASLRASAAGALGKIDDPGSRDALLAAAEDPDGRVRAAVVNGLGRIGGSDARVLDALDLRTKDPDGFVRNRAIIALARAGRAEAEPRVRAQAANVEPAPRLLAMALVGTETSFASVLQALVAPGMLDTMLGFLEREDGALRKSFFDALRLEDPFAAEAAEATAPNIVAQYEKTLRTSLDVDARRLAVGALQQLGSDRAIPALADAVSGDPNEAIRLRAAAALSAHVSDDGARRALVRAVADPNADVAMAAVRALGGRRDREVVGALYKRLGAGGEDVQDVVEQAIAELHADDPMPFLDWMMGVEVPDLLTPAVRVLARMANPTTLPLLRELLRSRSAHVRAAAVRALGNLDGLDAELAIEDVSQDPSEEVRVAVVECVRWNANAMTRLAQLRRDPSVRVRARLAMALERVDGTNAKSAHKALEGMVSDASPAVRAAALASLAGSGDLDGLRAFGRLWPQSALDTRLALRDEERARSISERAAACLSSSGDAALRRSAVVAMGALHAAGFSSFVVPALRDPSPDVRISAIQVLAAVDDEGIRERISEMVSDPEMAVQETARRLLVRTVG